jgi:hypothetical protein
MFVARKMILAIVFVTNAELAWMLHKLLPQQPMQPNRQSKGRSPARYAVLK